MEYRFKNLGQAWEKIGSVPVDSGEIMIADPCYAIEAAQNRRNDIDSGDFECGEGPVYHKYSDGSRRFEAGVYTGTAYGDGCYNVYVQRDDSGSVVKVLVDFIEEEDDDD